MPPFALPEAPGARSTLSSFLSAYPPAPHLPRPRQRPCPYQYPQRLEVPSPLPKALSAESALLLPASDSE